MSDHHVLINALAQYIVSIYVSIYLFVCLSIHLSINRSLSLSLPIYIYISKHIHAHFKLWVQTCKPGLSRYTPTTFSKRKACIPTNTSHAALDKGVFWGAGLLSGDLPIANCRMWDAVQLLWWQFANFRMLDTSCMPASFMAIT